jgi:hypothetical protein
MIQLLADQTDFCMVDFNEIFALEFKMPSTTCHEFYERLKSQIDFLSGVDFKVVWVSGIDLGLGAALVDSKNNIMGGG